MTKNRHSTIEPVDETWLAHVREVSTGVVPPTPANPHDMSRTAVRRTRTRRAVLLTGGGLATIAVAAGAAFAFGGPTTGGVLLPGSETSSVTPGVSAEAEALLAEADAQALRAEELRAAAAAAKGELRTEELQAEAAEAETRAKALRAAAESSPDPASGDPTGWEVHELEGLTYALPAEIVTSGPVQDEPGVTSDMWHSSVDPDAPPFFRIAYVTPDYEFYDAKSGGLTQTPGSAATSFELPGATVATIEDGTSEELREITAMPAGDGAVEPVRILVHRADGPGRYIITMTLPEGNDDLIERFRNSLTLN